MRQLKLLLVAILLVFNVGCNIEKKQIGPISYDQAIEIAKKYVLKSDLYKSKEIRYIYEPDCATWIAYSSRNPKKNEEYSLRGKKYYAIYFFEHHLMLAPDDFVVFIDKSKGCVIGVYTNDEFVKNSDVVWYKN